MRRIMVPCFALAMVACSRSGQTASTEASRPAASAPSAAAPAPVAAAPAPAARTAASSAPMQEIDLQANHPNGSTLRVTGVQFGDDHTSLRMTVTNGLTTKDIALNGRRDMLLKDNLGNRYSLVAPPENPTVNVAPGATIDGTFNFLGRLHPSATSATLVTNDMLGNGAWSGSTKPKIMVSMDIKR